MQTAPATDPTVHAVSDEVAVSSHRARVNFGGNTVLNDVSFEVPPGKLVGIVGPNGAGKSTLLKALVGIIELDSGSILINGKSPLRARGQVSYIPQSESVNWDFPVSVHDVVMMGCTPRIGVFGFPRRRHRDLAEESLNRVGLLHRAGDSLEALSGGQRQRIFVARALVQRADVLLLDEAFSGVDVASQAELIHVLRALCQEGKTVVMTTHDLAKLEETVDLLLCLNRHVCAFGPPAEALTPQVFRELYEAHGAAFSNME